MFAARDHIMFHSHVLTEARASRFKQSGYPNQHRIYQDWALQVYFSVRVYSVRVHSWFHVLSSDHHVYVEAMLHGALCIKSTIWNCSTLDAIELICP